MTSKEPGHLPLLEFALTELWRQQSAAGYETIGRVERALSRHADQVLADLSQTEQAQVRWVFIQLVQPGDGTTADTRRLVTKENLDEAGWRKIAAYASGRSGCGSFGSSGKPMTGMRVPCCGAKRKASWPSNRLT